MLPERLKKLRTNKEMSQRNLAGVLGVSQQTIGNWEVGRTSPDPEMINRIASFFNVSTDYLLGNDVPASGSLPPLTPKDECNIQKKLDSILNDLSPDSGLAYYNGEEPMSDDDKELLRISLENSLRLARQMAKQKFTPKKYRKNEPAADTATLIGKKILTASTDAQLAVSAIIEQDKKK